MQTLSDGFVPDLIAGQLGTPAQAGRLVDVGLWDRLPTGYAFHEWDHRQPSKATVHAEREATAKRQREFRERRKKETTK